MGLRRGQEFAILTGSEGVPKAQPAQVQLSGPALPPASVSGAAGGAAAAEGCRAQLRAGPQQGPPPAQSLSSLATASVWLSPAVGPALVALLRPAGPPLLQFPPHQVYFPPQGVCPLWHLSLGSFPLCLTNPPLQSQLGCLQTLHTPPLTAGSSQGFFSSLCAFCSLKCPCLFISLHVYDAHFSLTWAPQSRAETVLTPHRGAPGPAPSGTRKIGELIARPTLSRDVWSFCGMCTLSSEMLQTKLAIEGCRLCV